MIKRALTSDSYESHSKQDFYQPKQKASGVFEWLVQLSQPKNLIQLNLWKKLIGVRGIIVLSLIHLLTLAYLVLMVSNHTLSIQEQKNLVRQSRQEIKALTVKFEKFQVQAPQVKQSTPHQSNEGMGSDAEDEFLKLGPITYWGSIQGGKSPKALIEIEDQSSLYRLGQSIGHHYFIKHFDQERLILESKKGHQKVVMMEPAQ